MFSVLTMSIKVLTYVFLLGKMIRKRAGGGGVKINDSLPGMEVVSKYCVCVC